MKTEDGYLDRRIQQYRDAPKLEALIRWRLRAMLEAADGLPVLSGVIDDFSGDLLTKIGGILGFPRSHVVNKIPRVHGFGDASSVQIVGFGEGGTWLPAADFSSTRTEIEDDETFRRFLRAHILSLGNDAKLETITLIAKNLWGDVAGLQSSINGRIVVATGRALTLVEGQFWAVYPRLFPVPYGIRLEFHEGPIRVAGFGAGWGGFQELVPVYDDITGLIAGFDPDGLDPTIGGFEEPAYSKDPDWNDPDYLLTFGDGDEILIGSEDETYSMAMGSVGHGAALFVDETLYLVDENGLPIVVGTITAGARMCGRQGEVWATPADKRIPTI